MSLFVSAGEASGDRLASLALAHLPDSAFGMGGAGLRALGADTIVDANAVSVTGVVEVASRLPTLARALWTLDHALAERRPRAALLVDYPSFHRLLATRARRLGVPVVWCVAPQVWAWRPGRAPAFARTMSRLGVLFEHEVSLWRAHGVPTSWVGHPAAEAPVPPRVTESQPRVALLPGSRPNVVSSHLSLQAAVAARLAARGVRSTFLVSSSLPPNVRAEIALVAARVGASSEVCPAAGAASSFGRFGAALVTAGTTSLEVALAGVPFVVAHRVSPLTAAIARRLLRTHWVALPNILLARAVAPELLQEAATPDGVTSAVLRAIHAGSRASVADELRAKLTPRDGATFGTRMAAIVEAAP